MGKNSKNFAIGAVIAAVVGYVAGILTAPKSGKETRKDIQDKAVKTKAQAEKQLKKLHSELNDLVDKGKEKSIELKSTAAKEFEKAMDKAQGAKDKARNILSAVHEGDADDKELQAAIEDVNSAIDNLKKYVNK